MKKKISHYHAFITHDKIRLFSYFSPRYLRNNHVTFVLEIVISFSSYAVCCACSSRISFIFAIAMSDGNQDKKLHTFSIHWKLQKAKPNQLRAKEKQSNAI